MRIVELSHLVEHLGIIGQGLEAMSETLSNIERAPVLFGQFERGPLPKCRRPWPQIEDDIEDQAAGRAHKLCLFARRDLIMHAAQCAAATIVGNVALDKAAGQSMRGEFLDAEAAREKAPLIFMSLEVDDENPIEAGFREF